MYSFFAIVMHFLIIYFLTQIKKLYNNLWLISNNLKRPIAIKNVFNELKLRVSKKLNWTIFFILARNPRCNLFYFCQIICFKGLMRPRRFLAQEFYFLQFKHVSFNLIHCNESCCVFSSLKMWNLIKTALPITLFGNL